MPTRAFLPYNFYVINKFNLRIPYVCINKNSFYINFRSIIKNPALFSDRAKNMLEIVQNKLFNRYKIIFNV